MNIQDIIAMLSEIEAGPFDVVEEGQGCERCGAGKTFLVMNRLTGSCGATSYECDDDAWGECNTKNAAYFCGIQDAIARIKLRALENDAEIWRAMEANNEHTSGG